MDPHFEKINEIPYSFGISMKKNVTVFETFLKKFQNMSKCSFLTFLTFLNKMELNVKKTIFPNNHK